MEAGLLVLGIILIVLGLIMFIIGVVLANNSGSTPITNTQWWLLFVGTLLPLIGLVLLIFSDPGRTPPDSIP